MGTRIARDDDEIHAAIGMKKLLFLVAFLAFEFTFAQETNPVVTTVQKEQHSYNTNPTEMRPEFPGGMQAFYAYLSKEFKTSNVPSGLHGKVFVSFFVEEDGSLGEIKVLSDIGYGTGEEAIRVLKNSPKWIPGEQLGKKVRVQYALPIVI
jgi:protein TonB